MFYISPQYNAHEEIHGDLPLLFDVLEDPELYLLFVLSVLGEGQPSFQGPRGDWSPVSPNKSCVRHEPQGQTHLRGRDLEGWKKAREVHSGLDNLVALSG